MFRVMFKDHTRFNGLYDIFEHDLFFSHLLMRMQSDVDHSCNGLCTDTLKNGSRTGGTHLSHSPSFNDKTAANERYTA